MDQNQYQVLNSPCLYLIRKTIFLEMCAFELQMPRLIWKLTFLSIFVVSHGVSKLETSLFQKQVKSFKS